MKKRRESTSYDRQRVKSAREWNDKRAIVKRKAMLVLLRKGKASSKGKSSKKGKAYWSRTQSALFR